jgi:pimeloyl-ACP methyl ester carboxylesterase
MTKKLSISDINIPIDEKVSLGGVMITNGNKNNIPMVLIHGSLENGRIFYSKSLKGYAPFMAQNNYDVYVIDLRGKGKSLPIISKEFNFNQLDVIKDLYKVFNYVKKRYPSPQQVWTSHSWGGVLINCALLRYQDMNNSIRRIVHFGVKRSISVKSLKKYYQINLGFNSLMKLEAKILGYVSSRFFGSDSEAKNYHENQLIWVKPSLFVDPIDHFDYSYAAQKTSLPKSLYLAGGSDDVLGNIVDIKRFMNECNQNDADLWILNQDHNYLHSYDHNNMLTHKDAPKDIFQSISHWIAK